MSVYLIASVHALADGRYDAGMVVADDGIHAERYRAGSADLGTRVLDGDHDRRGQRAVVVAGRHHDGPDRPEDVRVFDRADNAGRLATDTGRSAGKTTRPL